MATTKWENFKIFASPEPDGKIYIGKKEDKDVIPGITLYSDKSDDRTDQCIEVVMQYMNNLVPEGDFSIHFRLPGHGTLTWKAEKPKEEEE